MEDKTELDFAACAMGILLLLFMFLLCNRARLFKFELLYCKTSVHYQ